MSRRQALVVRTDNVGDVVLSGPAVRAVASSASVTFVAGPIGRPAAQLLLGVEQIWTFETPWIAATPPPVQRRTLDELVERCRSAQFDVAIVLTSARQSPLPMALLLRLAGIPSIVAISHEYPGSLLDTRIPGDPDVHEVLRDLAVVEAAGFSLPPEDDGRLRIRPVVLRADLDAQLPARYVVVHPGASVRARTWKIERWSAAIQALLAAGHDIVVTGCPSETAGLAPGVRETVVDLSGQLDLEDLAAVLERADVMCCGNSGPLHLAGAVGCPVVAVFPPTVPRHRWLPWRVPFALLGDDDITCRWCYQRSCPLPDHPCVDGVTATQLVDAVSSLRSDASHRPSWEETARP